VSRAWSKAGYISKLAAPHNVFLGGADDFS